MAVCLKDGGRIYLWLTTGDKTAVSTTTPEVNWDAPHEIPLSHKRQILCGVVHKNLGKAG